MSATAFVPCDQPNRDPRHGSQILSVMVDMQEYLQEHLNDEGRDQLRGEIAQAATAGLDAVFDVLDSWFRTSLFMCHPDLADKVVDRIDADDVAAFDSVEDLFAAVDQHNG